jgi:5-methylcytosine-specific restriction endonuclease McrA
MSWGAGNAGKLPGDWKRRRASALARCNHQCEARDPDGRRCLEEATEVDHIVPIVEGGTHDWTNLRGLCHAHHAAITKRQSAEGRARAAAQGKFDRSRWRSNKRPPEQHPGLR